MARREELVRWIAETQRLQRKLRIGFAIALVPCLAIGFWNGTVATLATVCLLGTALVAFWVTYAHIASHRQKLDELARAERRNHVPEVAQRGGHRRWRSS